MKLKNKSIRIWGNNYGNIFLSTYTKNKKGVLESKKDDKCYKFDGSIDGVDLEISIPKGCRTEYAKIIKIK